MSKTCYKCVHIPVCARCMAITDAITESVDSIARACGMEDNYEKRKVAEDRCLIISITEFCDEYKEKEAE